MTATSDFVTSSNDELQDRIEAAHRRFADLAASLPADLPVDQHWSVRDVVAHVVTVFDRYLVYRPERIAADPRGVDVINDREVEELAGTDVDELLRRLATSVATLRDTWGARPLELAIPFHGGRTIDVQSGLTNAIGELLIHGHDVALAAGVSWPIDDRDGLLLLGFGTQILPAYVRSSNRGSATARIEVAGAPPWLLAVDGPDGTSRPAQLGDTADVVLSGSPTALVLAFYGRGEPGESDAFFDRFERP